MRLTIPGEGHHGGAGDGDDIARRAARRVDDAQLGVRGQSFVDGCQRTVHTDDEPGAVA